MVASVGERCSNEISTHCIVDRYEDENTVNRWQPRARPNATLDFCHDEEKI